MSTMRCKARRAAIPALLILAVAVATTVSVVGYRAVVRAIALRLAQTAGTDVGRSMAYAINHELAEARAYSSLTPASDAPGGEADHLFPGDGFDALLSELRIHRFDVHDRAGRIIFSSDRANIGATPSADAHLKTALEGIPTSRIADPGVGPESCDKGCAQLTAYVPLQHEIAGETLPAVLGIHMTPDPEIAAWLSLRVAFASAFALFPVAVAVGGVWFLRRHTLRGATREAARGAERTWRSQAVAAQETERKRISRELHDGIGQYLNAVKMRLQQIVCDPGNALPPAAAGNLVSAISIVASSIDEVRRISLAMRPSMLDDLGLFATVSWLCREFRSAHPAVLLETCIEVDESVIPDRLKTVIYRILQESLTNISRHSQATAARVTLGVDAGAQSPQLVLTVEDDGRGFRPGKRRTHAGGGLGIPGMQERAQLENGALTIDSAPGAGTRLRACWPLPDQSAEVDLQSIVV